MAATERIAAAIAAALLCLPPIAQASDAAAPAAPPREASWAAMPHKPSAHRAARLSTKAKTHFQAAWGIDALKVTRVASGTLIRFNYRVTDPAQAAPLVDRKVEPVLYAPRARAMLKVPVMEKIGPLRQVGTLKAGQDYWITFSNKGNLVRAGDRVNVIVGQFHADNLPVE